jgi:hypothetical protein
MRTLPSTIASLLSDHSRFGTLVPVASTNSSLPPWRLFVSRLCVACSFSPTFPGGASSDSGLLSLLLAIAARNFEEGQVELEGESSGNKAISPGGIAIV